MSKSKNSNLAKAKAYCDKHPGAFSIVKKEDHSIFKNLSDKEYKELKSHVDSKIPDIRNLEQVDQKEVESPNQLISIDSKLFWAYEEDEKILALKPCEEFMFSFEGIKAKHPITKELISPKETKKELLDKETKNLFVISELNSDIKGFNYEIDEYKKKDSTTKIDAKINTLEMKKRRAESELSNQTNQSILF